MAAWMVAMASTNTDEAGGRTDDDVMSVHVEAVRARNPGGSVRCAVEQPEARWEGAQGR
jgi:hypothetical protein